MKRRKAVAMVGAVSMTAASAALAIAANLGALGGGGFNPAQLVSSTSQVRKPVVVTKIVDVPSSDPTAGGAPVGVADGHEVPGTTETSASEEHPTVPESAPPATAKPVEEPSDDAPEPGPTTPHPDDSHPTGGQPGSPAGGD